MKTKSKNEQTTTKRAGLNWLNRLVRRLFPDKIRPLEISDDIIEMVEQLEQLRRAAEKQCSYNFV